MHENEWTIDFPKSIRNWVKCERIYYSSCEYIEYEQYSEYTENVERILSYSPSISFMEIPDIEYETIFPYYRESERHSREREEDILS